MSKKYQTVDGGFLQSEYWKNFQKSVGRKVVKVENEDSGALMIFYELPIVGGYFFVPRGPKFKVQSSKSKVQDLLSKMIVASKEKNVGWVRIEPQSKEDLKVLKSVIGDDYKIIKSKKNHEPAQTLMLDLKNPEEEILAQMKQKTRYNIRLASKRGVRIEKRRDDEAIQNFLELNKETAKRDGIVMHSDLYYKKMIKEMPEKNLALYIASYKEKVIAASLTSFFGGVATYLHGASSDKYRNVMAPFALQWQAIQDAKNVGCEKYDFGGTKLILKQRTLQPESDSSVNGPKHDDIWVPEEGSWNGISKFKLGFCPRYQPVEFPGCWDVVIDGRKYFLYRCLQVLKDFKKVFAKYRS